MKFAKLAAATALALSSLPALAAGPELAVGSTVYGPEGGVVGTVETIADGIVTVDTGKHKAPLPADVFGTSEKGPSITVTQVQINAMLDEQIAAAAAQRDAVLVAGAMVHTAGDLMLGNVKSVDGDDVVVDIETGPVTMKREHFAINANGTLIALFTMEQIEAAAKDAAASAGTSS
jgi:preprotein translocase subunit YajC